MRTIHRQIVSALIISKDNKIFLGKKHTDKGGVYADCWHFPGGGIDEGESLIQALHREVLEETGIEIGDSKVEVADDQGKGESEKVLKNGEKVLCKMDFRVYRVLIDKNSDDIKARASDDLEKIQWVDFDKLDTIKLAPPSVILFKRLGMIQ